MTRAERRPAIAWQRTRLRLPRRNIDSSASSISISRSAAMRFLHSFVSSLLLSGAAIVSAASSWSFEDATVSINSKGGSVGGGPKEKWAYLWQSCTSRIVLTNGQIESLDTAQQIGDIGRNRQPQACSHSSRRKRCEATTPGFPHLDRSHYWPGRVICTQCKGQR
jgi:hypothetical protein